MREWVLAAAIVLIAIGVAMQLGQREGKNMVAGERNDDETCEEILRTKVNQDVA
ncbi:MAG TPA: hypothetical protein VIA18_22105 [Polyangia bacterium]|jgi:hypothetical protein|nr:hypothetical protein [Polyangia bacterium]